MCDRIKQRVQRFTSGACMNVQALVRFLDLSRSIASYTSWYQCSNYCYELLFMSSYSWFRWFLSNFINVQRILLQYRRRVTLELMLKSLMIWQNYIIRDITMTVMERKLLIAWLRLEEENLGYTPSIIHHFPSQLTVKNIIQEKKIKYNIYNVQIHTLVFW